MEGASPPYCRLRGVSAAGRSGARYQAVAQSQDCCAHRGGKAHRRLGSGRAGYRSVAAFPRRWASAATTIPPAADPILAAMDGANADIRHSHVDSAGRVRSGSPAMCRTAPNPNNGSRWLYAAGAHAISCAMARRSARVRRWVCRACAMRQPPCARAPEERKG